MSAEPKTKPTTQTRMNESISFSFRVKAQVRKELNPIMVLALDQITFLPIKQDRFFFFADLDRGINLMTPQPDCREELPSLS